MLGHYHQFSVTNTCNVLHFVYKYLSITKSSVRQMLDGASKTCIVAYELDRVSLSQLTVVKFWENGTFVQ